MSDVHHNPLHPIDESKPSVPSTIVSMKSQDTSKDIVFDVDELDHPLDSDRK